jgi:hypothetical protein
MSFFTGQARAHGSSSTATASSSTSRFPRCSRAW